jgi:hypothetical protein
MGAEEYARKKYNEYDKKLNQTKNRADELKNNQIDFNSQNY